MESLGTAQTPPRPRLLDRKSVAREYGLSRVDVERVFRRLQVVSLPGSRKVYVARQALDRFIAEHTFGDDRVRPSA